MNSEQEKYQPVKSSGKVEEISIKALDDSTDGQELINIKSVDSWLQDQQQEQQHQTVEVEKIEIISQVQQQLQ